ncbi:MAG: plasmid replication initiation protein [Psychroserpens sp.]|jgi:plasmid replication initiation protein
MEIASNKNLVVSNQLVKGRYKLTKEEQNFIYLVISQLNQDDKKFTEYQIHIKDLETAELTKKNYQRYKDFARKLRSREIIIEDDVQILVTGWFSDIVYIKDTGYIKATISEKLKPYILELKKEFVQAKLPTLLKFKSKYTSRLFLLLKSAFDKQSKYKKNLFMIYDIDGLQRSFELPKSYISSYQNFKNRFLKTSIEEINEHANLYITSKELKTGRKVTSIEFCITEKEKTEEQAIKELKEIKTLSDYIPENLSSNAISVLLDKELGLKKYDLKHIFDHYKVTDIEDICEELWKCWDSPKIISKQGLLRGKIKQLDKKKTENLSFFDEV